MPIALSLLVQRVILRDALGREIWSEFYGESCGIRGEGIATDGALTEAERRQAVARLMSHIRASRRSGPFRWSFPEEFGRRSYVSLQPRTAGATDAPEFIEPDQTYDLSGLTVEFVETTTRPRSYIDIPSPSEDVVARETVSLHWAGGTVSLEEGALAMVRPEPPTRTMSADIAAAGNAVASFFTGANESFVSAIATVTGWLG